MTDTEGVIRMYLNPPIVTCKEYEEIRHELEARAFAGDITLGDRILAKLLVDHNWRYVECKMRITGKTYEELHAEGVL